MRAGKLKQHQHWTQGNPRKRQPLTLERWFFSSRSPSNPSRTLYTAWKPASRSALPASMERCPERQIKRTVWCFFATRNTAGTKSGLSSKSGASCQGMLITPTGLPTKKCSISERMSMKTVPSCCDNRNASSGVAWSRFGWRGLCGADATMGR